MPSLFHLRSSTTFFCSQHVLTPLSTDPPLPSPPTPPHCPPTPTSLTPYLCLSDPPPLPLAGVDVFEDKYHCQTSSSWLKSAAAPWMSRLPRHKSRLTSPLQPCPLNQSHSCFYNKPLPGEVCVCVVPVLEAKSVCGKDLQAINSLYDIMTENERGVLVRPDIYLRGKKAFCSLM